MSRFTIKDKGPQLVVFLAWFLSFLLLTVKTVPVSGDGIYYFSYLRSAVVDHDLDFSNELAHFADQNIHVERQLESGVTTDTGLTHNQYSIGPAILWAPFYAIGRMFALATGQTDGYSNIEIMSISVGTSLYGLLGLALAFRFLKKTLPGGLVSAKRKWSAALAVSSIVLGTNLIFYLSFDGSVAHVLGFFVVNLLLVLWLTWQDKPLGKYGWRWIVLGLVVGLAGLVRWQLLGVALIVPGLDLLIKMFASGGAQKGKDVLSYLVKLALIAVGAIAAFLPQMFAWKTLYGGWLVIPQGRGFLDLSSPHSLEVLISSRHGLFTWSPLIALGVVGLLMAWGAAYSRQPSWQKLKSSFAGLALLILLVQVYINGTAIEWWGGESFGPRRFTDISLVFMLGLGAIFQATLSYAKSKSRRWPVYLLSGLVVVLIAANLLLMQAYRHGLIPLDESVSFSQFVEAAQKLF